MDDLRQRIRDEMARPVVAGYRWVCLAFAIYLLILVLVTLSDGQPGRGLRAGAKLVASGVLVLCHVRLGTPRGVGLRSGQRVAAVAMGAILLQSLVTLSVLKMSHMSSDVMLWMVATGMVFRERLAFLGVLGTGLVSWGVLFARLLNPEHPLHWALGMVSASVVAWLLQGYVGGISKAQEDLRVEDRIRERTNEQLIEMLGDSLENIKTLRGLIPICAQCKKMRDDQGYWQQVEHYLNARSEAQFTHGICPDCAAKFREEFR